MCIKNEIKNNRLLIMFQHQHSTLQCLPPCMSMWYMLTAWLLVAYCGSDYQQYSAPSRSGMVMLLLDASPCDSSGIICHTYSPECLTHMLMSLWILTHNAANSAKLYLYRKQTMINYRYKLVADAAGKFFIIVLSI